MARFFIDRPIFAWVLAILTMFLGILSLRSLPVAQYPEIAPPQVSIVGMYPGANATTIENSVTQVIEQNLSGLDGFRYMNSSSTSQGSFQITLTFNQGVDPDMAQVQVQNKIQTALSTLPEDVQRQGVTVQKSSGSFFMVVSFYSKDGKYSNADIGDFINTNIKDTISRINGLGDIQFFGSGYAMRVWLDPYLLNKYGMTPMDVLSAIKEQNTQVAFGQLGATPTVPGQEINFTITAQTQLESVEQFEDIQLRVNEDGSQVRLADVARIELAAESTAFDAKYNNQSSAALGLSLASGANALDTAHDVKDTLKRLSVLLPEGIDYAFPYDTTPFVEISIHNVVKTLIEAVALVFVVMYLFLRNIRATIIPTLAIPVVLLGTFAVLDVFGFTLNTLTLFAMVLAIGLLVDDAIVVVENVERIMEEEGLSPIEATRKSMDQITSALVGIAVVLSAVFVPMAFLSGASGVIYRQFSITIITAMSLSVVCAIIFTSALCATILKSPHDKTEPKGIGKIFAAVGRVVDWPVTKFNNWFDRMNQRYRGGATHAVTHPKRYVVAFFAMLALIYYGFSRLPTSFLPDEDQGILIGMTIGPDGTALDITSDILEQISNHVLTEEKNSIDAIMAISGFSFGGRGGQHGLFFLKLKDWSERKDPAQKLAAIQKRLAEYLHTIPSTQGFVFAPPAIIELGTASGVSFTLQNVTGLPHQQFMGEVMKFMGIVATQSKTMNVQTLRPSGQFDGPQLHVDIDQEKARALQITVGDINSSLAIAWGSLYVNDFVDRGRIKKVLLQGDAEYRMQPEDFDKWYVRNKVGQMVPFSAFASTRWTQGSPQLNRFDGYSAFPFSIEAKHGFSTGEVMNEIEAITQQYLDGVQVQWTDTSYEERKTGNMQIYLYIISIFVIFLSLAALYESWSIPFAVIFTLPVGVIGAVAAANLVDIQNDVYFQVGLLTVLGLTSKNAILIIEFAKDLLLQGKNIVEATVEAAHLRLRPIIMTSLAFGFGVLPMALSNGAGSGAQNVVGRTVIGGMIGGTLLVLFYAPVFFSLIGKRFGQKEHAIYEKNHEDAAHK
ncbi:efflux RND transporter permease subunit [Wohlfahrtiimonas sp. G9077]|uniref:efflux RND transporter permease subunit n=1 Tax=Wohlfahrtiimonas sp. G9077 TaxID=1980118 RepID=UPI000B9862A5|nr:efflux RND transporter permease subunit [Wohlfahrtiimonas sp. G9077]OYQ72756.1 hydrophobe/amphiphile efflux-1 family RND transporter [Wohlfahrtiimonas sp. G9077]